MATRKPIDLEYKIGWKSYELWQCIVGSRSCQTQANIVRGIRIPKWTIEWLYSRGICCWRDGLDWMPLADQRPSLCASFICCSWFRSLWWNWVSSFWISTMGMGSTRQSLHSLHFAGPCRASLATEIYWSTVNVIIRFWRKCKTLWMTVCGALCVTRWHFATDILKIISRIQKGREEKILRPSRATDYFCNECGDLRSNCASDGVSVPVHPGGVPLVRGKVFNWFVVFLVSDLVNASPACRRIPTFLTANCSSFPAHHLKSIPPHAVQWLCCMRQPCSRTPCASFIWWSPFCAVWCFTWRHVCST